MAVLAQNQADLGGHLRTWCPHPRPSAESRGLKLRICEGHVSKRKRSRIVRKEQSGLCQGKFTGALLGKGIPAPTCLQEQDGISVWRWYGHVGLRPRQRCKCKPLWEGSPRIFIVFTMASDMSSLGVLYVVGVFGTAAHRTARGAEV